MLNACKIRKCGLNKEILSTAGLEPATLWIDKLVLHQISYAVRGCMLKSMGMLMYLSKPNCIFQHLKFGTTDTYM